MTSSVRLISVRKIPEASTENEFIWVYQMNDKWTPFSDTASSVIEKAFRHGFEEIFINEIYRIDLKHFVQEHIDDRNCKQSIRRRRRHLLKSSASSDEANEDESRRCERFSFPLGLVSSCSVSVDTNYYGSPFIAEWFLVFTNRKRKITFNSIFPALVQGLQEEGKTESERVVRNITDTLNKIRDESFRKREKNRMKELEICCAKLYTKSCFIYHTVNIALRDNDHTKLRTLGPYCFLVFNYIGRHLNDDFSIRRRFRQTLRPTKFQLTTVFRGDYISHEIIQEYQQAVGNNSKYFKWLSFVSTSRDQDVAESFARNVLYIIELQHYSLNDQFVDLSTISCHQEENEILLQPGVRFQVVKVEFDDMKGINLVHIKIVPSYVSTLT
ncbi:unnamed protein product [Rotaria sp. Silwood2]|nr:unnamed protein product [Rotaria sp. Silwood2]CAF2960646.1 unnamed protein product [Rotaria sp. Silwood2]CAF3475012.1 unnamed protein product [Rotaria sp. Silwood2]CAF4011560.1 unnamed protein product [Rotaria sp. Silwood2]CAF4379416.1 unnamed protein product [Rotaria sp. Silwood2]